MKGRWPTLVGLQLALTAVVFLVFAAVVADDGVFLRMLGESETWLMVLGLFGGVSVVQLIVLSPVMRRRARRERGVSVWTSLTVGAAMFALLTGTFVASIGHALFDESGGPSERTLLTGAAVAAASWIGGTAYFALFMRKHPDASREGLLQLMSTRILQASVFEAIANIPLDVMIRKKSDCHCADASIFAWAAAMSVGLVVFGPAVFLTLLRKDRAGWYRERCDACGATRAEEETKMTGGAYREAPAVACGRCGHA